ncbi:hypothetical protein HPULCUR_007172 [Helicostylum pulchrum]|uniref:Uncharacterized protein n=1 Tax=Helicostylum pulchrum TaxID=562976 RepID=A0ABP9Y3Z5_9FUNG
MTKLEISEPMLVVVAAENKSTSTFATTVVPYYGSRAPKQSVIETDRIILDMIDDIQATIQAQEWDNMKIVPISSTKRNVIFWKLRIVLCAIILLLLVVATVVISELTKERS